MADQWFAILDGVEIGPLSASQIKQLAESGKIGATTPVKRKGMERFIPASNVRGLIPVGEKDQLGSSIPETPQTAVPAQEAFSNVVQALHSGHFLHWYRYSSGPLMVESLTGRFMLLCLGMLFLPISFYMFSQSTMTDKELQQAAFEQFKRGEATARMVDQYLNHHDCEDYRKFSAMWGVIFLMPGILFSVGPILSTIALHTRKE